MKIEQVEGTVPLGTDERLFVLERVANGASFGRTHRLRDFLLYVGSRALDGRTAEITEQLIGIHVFQRGDRFSPSEDNIVRTTARSLRVKLKEHFETEGRNEPWRIEIPKGSYIPVFTEFRPPVVDTSVKPDIPQKSPDRRWLWIAIAIFALSLAGLWLGLRSLRALPPRSIFTVLMKNSPALNVVCSDSIHARYQSVQGRLTPLEDYASGQLFHNGPPPGTNQAASALWPLLGGQLLSDQEDVRVAMRLVHSIGPAGRVELRHPRTIRMSDLREGGDFLLMAGLRANPWVGVYEPNLTFQIAFPSATGVAEIRNTRPGPGEQTAYLTTLNGKKTGKAYARIALVQGLGGKGKVLLVAGTTGQATDAAGEVLMNPAALEEVQRLLGRGLTDRTTRLQILVETTALAGRTLDYRILKANF